MKKSELKALILEVRQAILTEEKFFVTWQVKQSEKFFGPNYWTKNVDNGHKTKEEADVIAKKLKTAGNTIKNVKVSSNPKL
jgi:hypothetical protein